MSQIPAYVINLKRSNERRAYMSDLLSKIERFETRFVEAVDGINMPAVEAYDAFDQNAAFKRYGRILRPGEVGCVLSHRKCAEAVLGGEEPFAFVCEDDLYLREMDFSDILKGVEEVMSSGCPAIVLLSGDYWYKKLRPLSDKYKMASVREAVCAQAYFMNKAAAECVLSLGPEYIADDWYAIFTSGVKLFAIYPHIADQNRLDFQTEISPAYTGYVKKSLSLAAMVRYAYRAVYKKVLKLSGHFEHNDFYW